MKISRIYLKDFKRFGTLEIDIRNNLTGEISDQFLILGDNGTGKTTVLQAVALCLSLVSGRIGNVSELDWQGWLPGRYEKWGRPVVELNIHFSKEEIDATKKIAEEWNQKEGKNKDEYDFILPGNAEKLRVRLEGERVSLVEKGSGNLGQFRGRLYASKLLRKPPRVREVFRSLPGIFWFDQFRNLASPSIIGSAKEHSGRVAYDIGVARLRKYLNGWKLNQLAGESGGPDWLTELADSFKRVFPGRFFKGLEPMYTTDAPAPEEYYFLLSDGNRTYDIEEMSAGEQSVFPLLFEFVRMQIRNSVVLIDEIDLNLHPPLAQALMSALPAIGPGCQFLLTTHSESVSALASPEEIFRMEGGRLCL